MFSTREVITHPSNLQCLPSKYAHQDQYLSHLIVGPVKPSTLSTIFIKTINTADITRTDIVIFSQFTGKRAGKYAISRLRSFFNLRGLGLRSLGKLFFLHLRLGRFWLSLWFSRSYRFSWRWRLIILKLLNVTLFFYSYSNDLREKNGPNYYLHW